MTKLALAALAATILIGTASSVYACKSKSAQTAAAHKTTVTYAVASAEATPAPSANTIDDKFVVCKTVAQTAPIAIEVEIPSERLQMAKVIHIRGAAIQATHDYESTPVDTVKKTVKMAATLGRAFVTTIGAVFGSLVDAAQNATSSLV